MKLNKIIYLLFFLASRLFSQQAALILTDSLQEYKLNPYLEIFQDSSGNLSINKIISSRYAPLFKSNGNKTPNFGHTKSAVWIRLKIKNNTNNGTNRPRIIQIKYANIHHIDYYLLCKQDSIIDSTKLGSLSSAAGRYPEIYLTPAKGKEYTIYMRFKSEASLTIPLFIYSPSRLQTHNSRSNTLNGFFIGTILIMFIINLFAYFSLKDKSYLYFSLSILAFLLYYLSYSGTLSLFIPSEYLWLNYYSIPFFLILINLFFLKLNDTFLQAKRQMIKWHRFFNFLLILNSLAFLILLLTNYTISISIITLLIMFSFIVTLGSAYQSWKNGFKPAGIFLFSYITLLFGAVIFSLVRFGFLPSIMSSEMGMNIGSLAYTLLMSFSLRKRILSLISEKKSTEKSLALNEQRFRSIIETSRDIIWEVDHEGRYTYISPTITTILGYKPEELLGKTLFNLMSRKEANLLSSIFKQFISAKQSFIQLENIYIHKNGKQVILESSGVPYFDENGKLLGYRGIDRDITAKREAINEKEKSEHNLKALLNATMEVAFLIDSNYKIIIANEAFAKVTGKEVDELIGTDVLKAVPPAFVEICKTKLEEAFSKGKPIRWEDIGITGYSSNSINPIRNLQGEVTSLAVFSVDISKRKQAELISEVLLNISNAVFTTKNMMELYASIHKEINKLIDARNFFVGLYDEKEQTITMPYVVDEKDDFTGIKIPLDKTLSKQIIIRKKAMLFTKEDMQEMDKQQITGSKYGAPSLLWLGVPLFDDDKVIGLIAIQSYSNEKAFNNSHLSLMEFVSKQISMSIVKKQREEKIHILSRATEQSPTIIIITNTKGEIEFTNPCFTRVTGYSFEEVAGKTPRIFKSGETPDEIYKDLWQTIKRGKDWKGEFHNKKKNGELYWEKTHITPIINDENEITHFLAIKEDVSEQKKLRQQLIQSKKMEAIGTLAGGIAHDFNNMLTVINGFSEIALMKTPESSPIYKDIKAIISASNRAEILTRQILAFSRKQAYQPKIVSINKIIMDLQPMIHRLLGDNIEIDFNLENNLPLIKADPSQIEQIFMNLIVNARDAMNNISGTKRITIHTRQIILSKNSFDEFIVHRPGQYIYFSVKDTGTGIDEEIKQLIFDPFFTTKETGKGTGLGLATVYGIIKQNNAYINFESELGKGSEFIIYWPTTVETTMNSDISESPKRSLNGKETILFVEDDPNLLKFAETALNEFGYQVITASQGEEALKIVTEQKIDLLISDYSISDINGSELAEKASQTAPHIAVLIISGYSGRELLKNSNQEFLQKPFSVQLLLTKVRDILDRKKEYKEYKE
jgi:PAS domain S-box-containing protein